MKTKYRHTGTGAKGFTLIELMVTAVIVLIITAIVYELYLHMHKTWLTEEIRAGMQQNARVAMDSMVHETMMMGYGIGKLEYKITKAESNEIEFKVYEKDYKSAANPYKYNIRYLVDTDHNLVRKVVSTDDASDPKTPSDSDYTHEKNLAENIQSVSFAYYDLNNANMDPAAGETDTQDKRDNIRRITITLVVKSDQPMPRINPNMPAEYKTMTLTADISPRNLWAGEVGFDFVKPVGVTASGVRVRDAQKVKPTHTCGNGVLKVQWDKNTTDGDLAGYLIRWGTTSGIYDHVKDVPVTETSHPSEAEISEGIDYTPYYSPSGIVNKYYVIVQTYDLSHNESELDIANDEVAAAAPNKDETDFTTGSTDSSCDLPKPDPPANFTAQGFTNSSTAKVMLNWTQSADPNVIGYRIYRSYSSISLSEPIKPDGARIKLVGKETANGGTLDYNTESMVDEDPTLKGCHDYYYAICSVTCDISRILGDDGGGGEPFHFGGRYGAGQYAQAQVNPRELTPPHEPVITAQAGWKRIWLQMTWPSDTDYDHTEIYFKEDAADQYDLPVMVADPSTGEMGYPDSARIPDRGPEYDPSNPQNSAYKGMFKRFGTKGANTIIFNSTTENKGDDDPPALDNSKNYSFLAVSYDKCGNSSTQSDAAETFAELCGDDPCGPPSWIDSSSGYPFIWVNESNTQKDASLWTLGSGGEIQAPIGLAWTEINKTSPDQWDWAGYTIKRRVHGAVDINGIPDSSWTTMVGDNQWNGYIIDTVSEGETYDFSVQAADCSYYNINPGEEVCCKQSDGSCVMESYSTVKSNNITSDSYGPYPDAPASYDYIRWVSISPGRVKLDSSPGIAGDDFHNKVTFFIRNTSKDYLTITNMRAVWSNTGAYLKTITIGGGDSVTPVSTGINCGLLSGSGLLYPPSFPVSGVQLQDRASAPGSPSQKIPVTLEFANADGVADASCDMRGQTITLEFRFKNDSMPNSAGTIGVSNSGYINDFTTGDLRGVFGNSSSTPVSLDVSRGPAFKFVTQNKPYSPTVAFTVISTSAITTMPLGYPEVDGLENVTVTGLPGMINANGDIVNSVEVNSTPPLFESVSSVVAYYAVRDPETDPINPDPSGLAFTAVTTVRSGSSYNFTIPGSEDVGVWYYLKAYSNLGSFCRWPQELDAYYYYKQLGFDPCHVTPARPKGLQGTPYLMNWSSVTTYDDGDPVVSRDGISYDVYRRRGLHAGDPTDVRAAGITVTSYTDPTYSSYSTIPLMYMVKAKNTCTDPGPNESDFSNKLVICPTGGTGSVLDVYPLTVYLGDPISVNVAVCQAANDKLSDGRSYFYASATTPTSVFGNMTSNLFPVYENGDTGLSRPTTVITSRTAGDPWDDNIIQCLGPNDMYGNVEIGLYDPAKFYGYVPAGTYDMVPVTVLVAVNPCDNVPSPPAGLTSSKNGSKVTLTWNKVTTNTDGTDAVYPPGGSVDDVDYDILVDYGTGELNLLASGVVGKNQAKDNGSTYSVTVLSSAKEAYDFYVRARDKCDSNNAEEDANSTAGPETQ